jgi:hypothetical protein
MAATSTPTLHRRLERLQSTLYRQLSVPLQQTSATMGPQIHQAPGDETLRSYLKRFQTMRNRIPEVTEAAVIEDFYRGSNDSAFVRAILQKAPTTSEQLFREADLYITADERAQDLIGVAKPAPAAPRRDANQQPDKRWEKRPREEVHAAGPPASRAWGGPRGGERTLDDILDAQCPYHKDMRHTLRNCRDFKHSVGHGRPFQPIPPPPPPRGGPEEPRQPQQEEEGGGGAFPRVDREVNVIFGGHGSQENRRQQKLNDSPDIGGDHRSSRSVPMVGAPDHLHSGRSMAQLRPPRQIFAPRRSGDPREQGEEGVSGRGEQHQRHLPSDTPRLGSSPQRAPRVRHPFLRHHADRRGIPAGPYLHACHLRNSGELHNRVPEVRSGELRLRVQRHHREAGIGKIHGHSTLHVHGIEDARTARNHNYVR